MKYFTVLFNHFIYTELTLYACKINKEMFPVSNILIFFKKYFTSDGLFHLVSAARAESFFFDTVPVNKIGIKNER
jgi:hypothetical protein